MIVRRELLAVLAASVAASHAASATANAADPADAILHVAIFRFNDQHLDAAAAAFRDLAAATRRQPGNLAYDVFRGIDDLHQFTIVERWASPAALAEHERSEVFIRLGRDLLTRYATLHDTITARSFA